MTAGHIECGHNDKRLTEECLQADHAAHKVVKVNGEVFVTVARHNDLMQRAVE